MRTGTDGSIGDNDGILYITLMVCASCIIVIAMHVVVTIGVAIFTATIDECCYHCQHLAYMHRRCLSQCALSLLQRCLSVSLSVCDIGDRDNESMHGGDNDHGDTTK